MDLPKRMYYKHGAYWWYPSTRDGRKKYGWVRLGADYQTAIVAYGQIEAENGGPQIFNTFGNVLDEFLRDADIADETRRKYQQQAKKLKEVFGETALDEIEPHHVAQYVDKRDAKVAANREKSLMSSVYSYAIRRGKAKENPCKQVRRFKEKARERYIRDDEFEAVWKEANPVVRAAMDLAYLTGTREGQLLQITWADVTKDGVWVDPAKGGKKVLVESTPEMQEVLARCRKLPGAAASIYVIHNRKGQSYTVSGFYSMFARAAKKAQVEDFHFHDIRAKAAQDYEKMGYDAQKLLGHRSRKTTEVYLKNREPENVQPNRFWKRGKTGE